MIAGWARRVVRAVGVLPLREALHSLTGVRSTLQVRARVRAEVRRAGERRITADVVTVIPTYRRPELLVDAVRSALEQSVRDHAVVVVSDGEPVPDVLPHDPRLHVIELQRNIGVAGAVRNVGIRLTSSRVIAFLDDDNRWLDGHLTQLLPAIDAGADIAYSDLVRVLPDGREYDRLGSPFDRRALRNENYVDINTVVIRRGPHVTFSNRRRRPLESPGEDWLFIWKMSGGRRVTHVPATTVRYLINPGSFFWPGFTEVAQRRLDARRDV